MITRPPAEEIDLRDAKSRYSSISIFRRGATIFATFPRDGAAGEEGVGFSTNL